MIAAVAAAAPSCGSKVDLSLPPAADLKVDAEPVYPEAALADCPTNLRNDPCPAQEAEDAWWNETLIWGRAHHDRVARICVWARDLGLKVPKGYCGD